MLKTLKGLVDQLHLFTGIHTAEAEIMEDHETRLTKIEVELKKLSNQQGATNGRVVKLEELWGHHKKDHAARDLADKNK